MAFASYLLSAVRAKSPRAMHVVVVLFTGLDPHVHERDSLDAQTGRTSAGTKGHRPPHDVTHEYFLQNAPMIHKIYFEFKEYIALFALPAA